MKGWDRYLCLAYCSSESITSANHSGHPQCWFVGVLDLLESTDILMDQLPLFQYSLDVLGHLLPIRQELNMIIQDDIYMQFIQIT